MKTRPVSVALFLNQNRNAIDSAAFPYERDEQLCVRSSITSSNNCLPALEQRFTDPNFGNFYVLAFINIRAHVLKYETLGHQSSSDKCIQFVYSEYCRLYPTSFYLDIG